MELLTARLSLRRPETGDAPAVLAVHADPRACAHDPSDALATMAEAEDLVGRWQARWGALRPRLLGRRRRDRGGHRGRAVGGPDWLYTLV